MVEPLYKTVGINWLDIALIAGLVLFTLTSAHALRYRGWNASKRLENAVTVLFLLLWIVGPPIWFHFEFSFLFSADAEALKNNFDHFKYSQELAAKVWAGVLTFFFTLYKLRI